MTASSATWVTPPTVDPERWAEHAVFRETFLLDFTDPAHGAALRAFGALLDELERDAASLRPSGPHLLYVLRAAAGDLRQLQGFLAATAADIADGLDPDWPRDKPELRLARLAQRIARRVAKVADAIDQGLGTSAPAQPEGAA